MVVQMTLNVKHIRGSTFQIECDRDSDCIGVKVLIWEVEQIPIEQQRLVFAGKELPDNMKLSQMGISDDATLFLVESNPIQAQQDAPQVHVVSSIPQEGMVTDIPEAVSINSRGYEPLDEETASEERIEAAIDLGFWVRLYVLLGAFISIVCVIGCLWALLPFIFYMCGYMGTRRLNRCLLVFPLIMAGLIGGLGTICSIWGMIEWFHPAMLLMLLMSVLHIMIFGSIIKLMKRCGDLSCNERLQAVARIRQRGCCC